jgi:hypothetical protein
MALAFGLDAAGLSPDCAGAFLILATRPERTWSIGDDAGFGGEMTASGTADTELCRFCCTDYEFAPH